MENLDEVLRNAGETDGVAAFEPGAAVVERAGRAVLRLTGKDPLGMLGAILTNDVPQEAGLGAYALLLNPKGRVLADLRVIKGDADVLIDTEPEGAGAAREILGRYAPFSRVTLEDLSGSWSVLGLYGPRAEGLLGGLRLAEHESAATKVGGAGILAVGVAAPVAGYDLVAPESVLARAREHLIGHGASPANHDAYETARISEGIPRFGTDITPENFPGEAGVLDRAVSFSKGCYPGQETVARMRYRGHPNRTLHRLTIEGDAPMAGAEVSQDGKRVGIITSVAPMPVEGKTLALGYLSRNADPSEVLETEGGSVRSLGEVS